MENESDKEKNVAVSSSDVIDDCDVLMVRIASDASAFKYASEALRADREVVLAAVSLSGKSLRYATPDLRADREVVIEAIKKSGKALQYAASNLQADREVVMEAIKSSGKHVQFASDELRNDREIMFAAVSTTAGAMRHASENLKENREFSLKAVGQSHGVFAHVADRFRSDEGIVLEALKHWLYFQRREVFEQAPGQLMTDRNFILRCVKEIDGDLLGYTLEEFRSDRNIVLEAVKQNGLALRHAADSLQSDPEVVREAVKQNGLALIHVEEEFQTDPEIAAVVRRLAPDDSPINCIIGTRVATITAEQGEIEIRDPIGAHPTNKLLSVGRQPVDLYQVVDLEKTFPLIGYYLQIGEPNLSGDDQSESFFMETGTDVGTLLIMDASKSGRIEFNEDTINWDFQGGSRDDEWSSDIDPQSIETFRDEDGTACGILLGTQSDGGYPVRSLYEGEGENKSLIGYLLITDMFSEIWDWGFNQRKATLNKEWELKIFRPKGSPYFGTLEKITTITPESGQLIFGDPIWVGEESDIREFTVESLFDKTEPVRLPPVTEYRVTKKNGAFYDLDTREAAERVAARESDTGESLEIVERTYRPLLNSPSNLRDQLRVPLPPDIESVDIFQVLSIAPLTYGVFGYFAKFVVPDTEGTDYREQTIRRLSMSTANIMICDAAEAENIVFGEDGWSFQGKEIWGDDRDTSYDSVFSLVTVLDDGNSRGILVGAQGGGTYDFRAVYEGEDDEASLIGVLVLTSVAGPQGFSEEEILEKDWGDGVDEIYVAEEYEAQGDREKAIRWYEISANMENVDAQCALGFMYRIGDKAEEDQAETNKRFKEANKWFKKAAEQGDRAAQWGLGSAYHEALGVEQDFTEAMKWYRLAAEQGDDDARFELGRGYEFGEGVEKDPVEAMKWYRLAAEQGYTEAQFELGWQLEHSEDQEKDSVEAIKWYRLAAEQEHRNAQCRLGFGYHTGFGVEQHLAEAIEWYGKALMNKQVLESDFDALPELCDLLEEAKSELEATEK